MRLHDQLDFHAREAPDTEFVRVGNRKITYGEAEGLTHQLGNGLLAEGLRAGDRVALLAKNCLEYALFYYACSKAGVVPVPLNYRLAPAEWSYIINDAGVKLVLARGEYVAALDRVRSELRSVRRFLSIDGPPADGWDCYDVWLLTHSTASPARSIDSESPAYQMYTSGTTGLPKGAVIAHRAVTSNAAQLLSTVPMARGDRYLIPVPLYHAAAAMALFVTVAAGGTTYLHEDFNPHELVRALSEDEIAYTTLVPAMLQACLRGVPGVEDRKYPKLQRITYGASPIDEGTLRLAMRVFGCEFAQGYGLTESTSVLTLLLPSDHERALKEKKELLRSCGRPLQGTEVRIVDVNGYELPPRQIGEIVARGPQLMTEYWGQPEATQRTLAGGWLHTDDLGMLDEEGYVYLIDRVKDMIISGGENVYPSEVENALLRHPAVADAAVIGIPDERWGETVKAIVVLQPGMQASAEELAKSCREWLAGYKVPRSVDFIAALPRNASGKVLKKELREPYWRGHTRRVS